MEPEKKSRRPNGMRYQANSMSAALAATTIGVS